MVSGTGKSLLVLTVLMIASGAAAGLQVTTDAVDDLANRVETQSGNPHPAQRNPALDLVALEVTEGPETFTFRLEVASLEDPGEVFIVDDTRYLIRFTHEDQLYQVRINRALAEQDYTWGNLEKYDPDQGFFNFLTPLVVTQDVPAASFLFELDRQDLLDSQGAAPFPGRSLSDFHVESHLRTSQGFININNILVGGQWDAYDFMPDDGPGGEPVVIELGLRQSGHASLFTPAPMRASNGEATTFVFTVMAQNTGTEEDLFELVALDAPSAWDVTIPDSVLRLAGGQSVEIPVLVSTPFRHQHGTVESMGLELRSTTDSASIGRAELGIRYHAVPQPAGHHDELFIHSTRFGEEHPLFVITDNLFAGNSGQAYMNTLQEDDNDQGVPIKGNYQGFGCHQPCGTDSPPHSRWQWFIFLQPGLEMGLDFDLSRAGTLTVPIATSEPLVQAQVGGQFVHFAFDELANQWSTTIVSELTPSAPVDLGVGGEQLFQFDVVPNPEADRLEYAKRAFFGLWLNLTTPRASLFTGAEAPELRPGGTMQLPLFEYRDPVDDLFNSLAGLAFVTQEQERYVNPGEGTLFKAELKSELDRDERFQLSLAGLNAEWGRLGTSKTILVPAGGSHTVHVLVEAPDDAAEDVTADLVLSARGVDDPDLRSLVRLVAVVDSEEDHPDDAAAVAEAQTEDAPGAPLIVALLVALGLAWSRRRVA
ncbi:MAG: hypothetical protein ACPGQL_00070 [Thermoplasmatota archaeon]